MQSRDEAHQSNFLLPVRDLESERVKLTPFIVSKHAQELFETLKVEPELVTHLPYGPFDSVQELLDDLVIGRVEKKPDEFLFAIFDKTGGSERMAGVVGLVNTLVGNASTEIGFIKIFSAFQRTHVSTHTIGLLLHYLLDLPESQADAPAPYGPGLGLRRVMWEAFTDNATSRRAAERMGFKFEGIQRWQCVMPALKEGRVVPRERAGGDRKGRHTAILALCWDDWELEGTRELVRKQMARTGNST